MILLTKTHSTSAIELVIMNRAPTSPLPPHGGLFLQLGEAYIWLAWLELPRCRRFFEQQRPPLLPSSCKLKTEELQLLLDSMSDVYQKGCRSQQIIVTVVLRCLVPTKQRERELVLLKQMLIFGIGFTSETLGPPHDTFEAAFPRRGKTRGSVSRVLFRGKSIGTGCKAISPPCYGRPMLRTHSLWRRKPSTPLSIAHRPQPCRTPQAIRSKSALPPLCCIPDRSRLHP